MFGIGMPELLLILALAIIVIGPKKLPDIARAMGKGLAEFRRATDELRHSISEETRVAETREKLLREGKIRPPGAEETPYPEKSESTEPSSPSPDVTAAKESTPPGKDTSSHG